MVQIRKPIVRSPNLVDRRTVQLSKYFTKGKASSPSTKAELEEMMRREAEAQMRRVRAARSRRFR